MQESIQTLGRRRPANGALTLALALAAAGGLARAEERPKAAAPVVLPIGSLSLRPSGFFEMIGMSRTATTPDSVSTKFGKIPLEDTPGEGLASPRHSRFMLKGDLPWGPVKFSGYMESDFMNFTSGQSSYRWRQYWGQAQIGKWEILGGQAWSLLRPNRVGIATEKDMMNTDVIDPAYHVGLVGSRRRQVRVARGLGAYKAAVAWESDGNVLGKVTHDRKRLHLELAGSTGRYGRRGVSAAGVFSATSRVRLVTQQFWAKRAAFEALGVVPTGVNGYSTLHGVEAQVRKSLEIYSYAGAVWGSHSTAAGNRVVRQYTAGFNYKLNAPYAFGNLLFSIQYSHLDRNVWSGRSGGMEFMMCRFRYAFN